MLPSVARHGRRVSASMCRRRVAREQIQVSRAHTVLGEMASCEIQNAISPTCGTAMNVSSIHSRDWSSYRSGVLLCLAAAGETENFTIQHKSTFFLVAFHLSEQQAL